MILSLNDGFGSAVPVSIIPSEIAPKPFGDASSRVCLGLFFLWTGSWSLSVGPAGLGGGFRGWGWGSAGGALIDVAWLEVLLALVWMNPDLCTSGFIYSKTPPQANL